ncbi:MAG: sulfatase-like hydrolase/transferase [Bacteroidales bacterium]|nr:sulfatase-like hydrolase/transferase [Bacteroidales bacterium]MCF8389188.1 sulfatase-like hydrolase/transferase [Bacteroidales bacterium]
MNQAVAQEISLPNIIIIITDDQGYADLSFNEHHPAEVNTPNMDALAYEGIFFSQAYISGNVCSPTRAGLLTGRYQQRAGVYTAGEGGSGIDLSIPLFPKFLESKGYVMGAFGKWHMGSTPEYNPVARGFNEFYGFMGRGAHDYYDLDDLDDPLFRGLDKITAEGYLTNLLTGEAVNFIKNHKDEPFFCYLAYNAVHSPMQAPAEDIADFDTGDTTRNILMAMLRHLDNGVGEVVNTLKAEGLWENTLLFFLTDNGGAGATHANNSPLRGLKGQNWEGGIRTPFVISWPVRFAGSRIVDTPIISLDILPTVLDALDIEEPTDLPLDGKSILPALTNEDTAHHKFMFWSEGGDKGTWAVRYKDWKLVVDKDEFHLADLKNDISESINLIDIYPDTADQMINAYLTWLNEMAEPMQEPGKEWIPKIESGQLVSLYNRLYFRGNVQNFNKAGVYNAADLTEIGEDKAQSILIADGYEVKAYSEDEQKGTELIANISIPFFNYPDYGLSSFIIAPKGGAAGQDVGDVTISASNAQNSMLWIRDNDYDTYWESATQGDWIRFEFCQKVSINGIHIAFKRGHLRKSYFDVETSLDGQTWYKVINGGESSGTTVNTEFFPFPLTTARYLRIVGFGNYDNNQNHYTEVKFSVVDFVLDGIVIKAEEFTNSSQMDVLAIDDCVGYFGITNEASDATVEYNINDVPEGNYQFKIRAKLINTGDLDIQINNASTGNFPIMANMLGASWTEITRYFKIPSGDKKLKLTYSGNGSKGIELNWYQLTPSTNLMEREIRSTQIYPNPCLDKLHIDAEESISKIEIFDKTGRRIIQHLDPGNFVTLPLEHLMDDVYFIRILHTEGIEIFKFIKM